MIARLLDGGPQVLATGGGAFMNADTRAAIKAKGVSIWLQADLDVLMRRISKRKQRTADAADRRSGRDVARSCWPSANRPMRRPISPCSRAKCRTTRSSPKSCTALAAFLDAPPRRRRVPTHDRALRPDSTTVARRARRRAATTSSSAAACSRRSARASRRCGRAPRSSSSPTKMSRVTISMPPKPRCRRAASRRAA